MKQIIESKNLSQDAVNRESSVWGMLENDSAI
jgi:hypothetical protein